MKNTYIYILLAAFLVVSPDAGAQKLSGSIEATDLRLTNTGSTVSLEMLLQINDNAASKCQSVAVIPTLSDGSRSADFPYVLINGRKAKNIYERRDKFGFTELRDNPPYRVVNMSKKLVGGTTVSYSAEIPAAAWTDGATLKLGILLASCAGERQYYAMETTGTVTAPATVITIEAAPQVTTTESTRPPVAVEPPATIAETPVAVEPPVTTTETREHCVEGCAYLDFEPDSYEIQPHYKRNAEELAAICRVMDKIKSNPSARVTELSITGYASPDGRYTNNEKLAYYRALSVAKYLQPRYGISVRDSKVWGVAEDWTKLRDLVSASDIAHKREILQIIDSSDHPDVRESRLRRLGGGRPWKVMIDTMFPQLRRVEYKVTYTIAE